jgi:hypothetical protein
LQQQCQKTKKEKEENKSKSFSLSLKLGSSQSYVGWNQSKQISSLNKERKAKKRVFKTKTPRPKGESGSLRYDISER